MPSNSVPNPLGQRERLRPTPFDMSYNISLVSSHLKNIDLINVRSIKNRERKTKLEYDLKNKKGHRKNIRHQKEKQSTWEVVIIIHKKIVPI